MSTKKDAKVSRTPVSDESEVIAIENAMKHGRPVYFLMHTNGSTIDAGVDQTAFLKAKEEYIRSTPDGRFKIRLYERIATELRPI